MGKRRHSITHVTGGQNTHSTQIAAKRTDEVRPGINAELDMGAASVG